MCLSRMLFFFFSELQHVLRSSAASPTWPSMQAGCPAWQLEIISFISHFGLVTHICRHEYTHQNQRHQTKVWMTYGLGQYLSISFPLRQRPLYMPRILYLFFNPEPDLQPSYPPSIPPYRLWGSVCKSCAQIKAVAPGWEQIVLKWS